MFPLIDIAYFKLRARMPPGDVDMLDLHYPGFLVETFATSGDEVYSRLRKRYGGNAPPLGLTPAPLVPAGTSPPPIVLSGRPTLGSIRLVITITTPGPVGTAVFSWSPDAGVTTISDVVTGASVVLGTTGIVASFDGTYGADNVYASGTQIPRTVLGWVVTLSTVAAYERRGNNPQDPQQERLAKDHERADAQMKEAADSKEGLFDLPVSEDLGSAIDTGGPLGFSQASPFAALDMLEDFAVEEDARSLQHHGFFGVR